MQSPTSTGALSYHSDSGSFLVVHASLSHPGFGVLASGAWWRLGEAWPFPLPFPG